jgi:hypothetical protein
VQVPARWSDDGKPHAEYFKTKEEGFQTTFAIATHQAQRLKLRSKCSPKAVWLG